MTPTAPYTAPYSLPELPEAPALYTVAELAELARVPDKTVYEWNSKGTGPRITRVGKFVRYRREDVEAWLASRREPARVPAA